MAKHTGQDLERIKRDTDRDFFMSGEQAKDYGLVDDVITGRGPRKLFETPKSWRFGMEAPARFAWQPSTQRGP